MTFLELCQKLAVESGTAPTGQPPTVVNQTGRLADFVRWTSTSWTSIQNQSASWRWMRDEFDAPLTIGQVVYSGADLSLSRFAELIEGPDDYSMLSIYDPAHPDQEGPLQFYDWATFYRHFRRGSNRTKTGTPVAFAVDDQDRIVVWPAPATAHNIRGFYRKTPQILTLNTDVPEMPARFHDIIVWNALVYLAGYDEAMTQFPMWRAEFLRMRSELENDQLPKITIAGCLA